MVVQHVAYEGPGLVADALGRAGQEPEVVRIDRGRALPDPEGVAGLVVMIRNFGKQ